MMEKFKRRVGSILGRRQALGLFGAAGVGLFAAGLSRKLGSSQAQISNSAPLSSCVVRPAQTEGPYFVDERLHRSDIRFDANDRLVEGALLQLTLHLSQIGHNACTPIAGAIVDIWHCDANGIYSNVIDSNFSTIGQQFLRGYQVTDTDGLVQFMTIYPGWYPGRATHIHFKVSTDTISGQHYEFTSQLYFDDSITDQVYTESPYASRRPRDIRNSEDRIFRNGGEQLLLAVTETGQGYAAQFELGLQIG